MWQVKEFWASDAIGLETSINQFLRKRRRSIINAQTSYAFAGDRLSCFRAIVTYETREDDDLD